MSTIVWLRIYATGHAFCPFSRKRLLGFEVRVLEFVIACLEGLMDSWKNAPQNLSYHSCYLILLRNCIVMIRARAVIFESFHNGQLHAHGRIFVLQASLKLRAREKRVVACIAANPTLVYFGLWCQYQVAALRIIHIRLNLRQRCMQRG